MQQLLNQARGLSQSTPSPLLLSPTTHDVITLPKHHSTAEPVRPIPTTAITSTSQHTHHVQQKTSQQNTSPLTNMLNATEGGKSTPVTTHCGPPQPTTISQIPSSLQRLAQASSQAKLSAPPHSPGSSSSHMSSRSSSPSVGQNHRPPPLSIPTTISLNGKHLDGHGPTPLTPLSPYTGQQGMQSDGIIAPETL